ncbi:response regulator transcription factor [Aurantiacibacter poecillastricola]|uniref:response regulator transcription factor n=1 Tax=Aurantiacibacter poecillastricola TaxID=3064385 RepID=UPI00273F4975|nr:response regulator transcription factor [Aurantiacibacter sp. 219JJ12-13]MDP5259982.1 response regulator transcription factor [Aurantiacibacter sp. 219JJ12-13]
MLAQDICASLVCVNSLAQEGLKRILNEDGFALRRTFKSCDALLDAPEASQDFDQNELLLVDRSATRDIARDIAALRERNIHARIVLLDDRFDFETMVEVFRSGADGYLIKEIDYRPFLESLRLVAMGEKVLPGALANHLPEFGKYMVSPEVDSSEVFGALSDREVETLRCLIMGYPNKIIAYRLDISEATVKVHVKAILRKLGVQNRTQAAIWAVGHGLEPHGSGSAFPFLAKGGHSPEADLIETGTLIAAE